MIALELGGWLAATGGVVAAAGARRALAGRMETVARACHELRGPLTAVRLGLDYGAGNGELTPGQLRAIGLELGRAALVLEDLDAVRTRHARSRPPESIDLEQFVSDSVEAWRPTAVARGVELRASWSGDAPTVWGHRLRLAQVTGNLIANAIEHGGGTVEVHGHGDRMRALIEVSDAGPGLPAPFAELARGAQRGRGRRGRGRRGRGLAIAAAIAADQGGRLTSVPSARGARLVLELPAGRPRVGGGEGPAPAERVRVDGGEGPARPQSTPQSPA